MRRAQQQIIEGEWTRWNRKDRWLCCDCLMVHEVEFRIEGDQEHIAVRMKVNRRSTSAYRRWQGIKLIKTNGTHRDTESK